MLACQPAFLLPVWLKMQMAVWPPRVPERDKMWGLNDTSHPLSLWGRLELLLSQTSHRLCQQPARGQWITGLSRHQRSVSISPVPVQTGRYMGPTTKRAQGRKAVILTWGKVCFWMIGISSHIRENTINN